jgi:rhodanese-related sulfurtransferase
MKWMCFAVTLALLVAPASGWTQEKKPEGKKAKAYKDVGPEQFDKLRANKDAVVLDVRRPSEFTQGHIAGATNIDWYAADFEQRISGLDKSKTYLVHCAGGVRSSKAAEKMTSLKFTNVVNLEGGFKAWEAARKPVKKGAE